MANVIAETQRSALILAHNKTLAAQLYGEFKLLFPNNAVEYFVSYYDYYQPEAYVPTTDTYIAKDALINEENRSIAPLCNSFVARRERCHHHCQCQLHLGLGSAEAYHGQLVSLRVGDQIERDELMGQLVEIQYERNDYDFHRGTFRERRVTLEVFPVHEDSLALRIEFFGDEVEGIYEVDPLRSRRVRRWSGCQFIPVPHYVVGEKSMVKAIEVIRHELGTGSRN